MSVLDQIDTIVFMMLENRSFDHMLGHLSLPPFADGTDVDGLKAPLNNPAYENVDASGQSYYPFQLRDGTLSTDVPHERDFVAAQLSKSNVSGQYTMSGFVRAYYQFQTTNRTLNPDPMGFLTPVDVPITNFLAKNYCVCDRWFSSLPASTQPNRLMSLTGDSLIDYTTGLFPKRGDLHLDWLTRHGIPWRVYHCGISFFALLGYLGIFGENFRNIDNLASDVMDMSKEFPKVIVVEPSFGDAPHIGNDVPNDNHPPLAVAPGEAFLRQVYEALTANPKRWARTLMVLTYDEHGGFFDHVPPLPIPYSPPAGQATYPRFESLGIRVPSLIISPLVAPQSVFHGLLDHTSMLQLLAEKFAPQEVGYSASVNQRRDAGINSVSRALNLTTPRTDIPDPPPAPSRGLVSFSGPDVNASPMQHAFQSAAQYMNQKYPNETADKYPEIRHWALMQDLTRLPELPEKTA